MKQDPLNFPPWIPIHLNLLFWSLCVSCTTSTTISTTPHFLKWIRNLQDSPTMGSSGYNTNSPTSMQAEYPSSADTRGAAWLNWQEAPTAESMPFGAQLNERKLQGGRLHPQKFLEVSSPIHTADDDKPCASLHLLHHAFGDTVSPARANYTPPSSSSSSGSCGEPGAWSMIILRWKGASIGRQYDRIAAVWMGGVELLRTSTAEPSRNHSIYWNVRKDITRYASILATPQPLVVELGNVVNENYTGIFHIDISLDFYSMPHLRGAKQQIGQVSPADLVLPISQASPYPSGHWFQISDRGYVPRRSFLPPKNAYKLVLEIYVSFHGADEFWYTNPPNEYVEKNNLSGLPGNGPFREVQVFLDGDLVGAIWPFPVVYTGGIVNLYWRPVVGIGAFDLPTYEFDVSPFIGNLVDGKEHSVGFKVENGLDHWLIDGSLHVWLDHNSIQTSGKLLQYIAPPYTSNVTLEFEGLNGTFYTTANRSFSYSGYVLSSMGNITSSSSHTLKYENVLVFANNTATQIASQKIESKAEITKETPSHLVFYRHETHKFPLHLSCLMYQGPNTSTVVNCNFHNGLNARKSIISDSESHWSSVRNKQHGEGEITISDNTVVKGLAGLHQDYHSKGIHGCYKREMTTRNSTILKDSINSSCAQIEL